MAYPHHARGIELVVLDCTAAARGIYDSCRTLRIQDESIHISSFDLPGGGFDLEAYAYTWRSLRAVSCTLPFSIAYELRTSSAIHTVDITSVSFGESWIGGEARIANVTSELTMCAFGEPRVKTKSETQSRLVLSSTNSRGEA